MCNNATVGIRRGSFEWEVLQYLIEKPDWREFRGLLEPFWGFGAELGVSLKSGDYVGGIWEPESRGQWCVVLLEMLKLFKTFKLY